MDYLKQMSDTGVIDFDEMDDRIDDLKEKKKEQEDQREKVTIDKPSEPKEEDGQSRDHAHDLTQELNEALSKVQDNHQRELNRLEKAHDHLKDHLKELRHEIKELQDNHEKTRSQVKRLSEPPTQTPNNHQAQHPNQGQQTQQQNPHGHPQQRQQPNQNTKKQQPQSQPHQNQQPQSRSQGQSQGKADPKTSDYSSEDVALTKVFDTDKTL